MLIAALSFVGGFIVFAVVSSAASAINAPKSFLREIFSALVNAVAVYTAGVLVVITFYVLMKGAK